jgi:uncharacterized protein (DUF488 family)
VTATTVVYTLGHSSHTLEKLRELLQANAIEAVADVRSFPYSRRNPQFNRPTLRAALKACGIKYVFLGKELGARTEDDSCYEGGKVRYDRLAARAEFKQGIERVLSGARRYRLALLCAERDPVTCHRSILVARELAGRGIEVVHIGADGGVESHDAAMSRLMDMLRLPKNDLYVPHEALLKKAYEQQEARIAYSANAQETESSDIVWA